MLLLFNLTKKLTPARALYKKYSHLSFYKRDEPKIGVNFTSEKSKEMLRRAIKNNLANPFFDIIDQYSTQSDPAFCGLTNLRIMLNTLKTDPKKKWKGIWRWYSDQNISCINYENIIDYGMTLSEWALLFKCNAKNSIKVFRPGKKEEGTEGKNPFFGGRNLREKIVWSECSPILHGGKCGNRNMGEVNYSLVTPEFFKAAVISSCLHNNFYLMCNLGRKPLGQTGDGHFTPVVAYEKNMGLLLDSARFKYNSRWYKIEDIYKALETKDGVSGMKRGFLLINKSPLRKPKFISANQAQDTHEFLQRINFKKVSKNDQKLSYILNFLMSNGIKTKDKTKQKLTKILFETYKKDAYFKKMCDFIYMFDREEFIDNIIGVVLEMGKNMR